MNRTMWVAIVLGIPAVGMSLGIPEPAGAQPRVVSTTTIIGDWTAQIGGDLVASAFEHQTILQPGVDPHIYEPVPADSIAIEQADLILFNGYELEPELIRIIRSTGSNARQVPLAEGLQPLALAGGLESDPHLWGDVQLGMEMVETLIEELQQLLPEEQEVIATQGQQYLAQLRSLHEWVGEQIATIPPDQRRLVTTHDAFQYYAQAYGLEVVGSLIGLSTEEQPSAQTVARLVQDVQQANVPAIFAETTINPALIQTVAEEAGVELAEQELFSDSLGSLGEEGDTYVGMIVSNTCTIAIALGGSCAPFEPESRSEVTPE
ncbi:MAG: zinc ABC transporter solute-binding protein [Synechococcaceae cyanobacterium RM1_1_27]|nr:zinc ABC transporter solute-binding protein [Synechococcaceae cyanobacterium RM1_1_27]